MKKRLLSAALALAMVLTLIPTTIVPAFAATTTGGQKDPDEMGTGGIVSTTNPTTGAVTQTIFYQVDATHNTTQTVSRCTTPGDGTGREYGKWYWLDNKTEPQNPVYYEVTEGFIVGNNGSGLWYPDIAAFTTESDVTTTVNGVATTKTWKRLRSSTLTLLGTTSLNMGTGNWSDTTLNVDIAGSGTLTLAGNATNVTVTSKFVTGTPTGNIAAITRNHKPYATTAPGNAALTLNATNVNVGAISLTGRSNTVTLTNCVASTIGMDGETVTAVNASTGASTTSFLAQRFTATGGKITGAMTIKGDGSAVSLTSVNSAVTATGAVSIEGHGGSLTIAGASNVAAVTAKSRATKPEDTTISNIPSITVSGGTVTSISTDGATGDKGNGSANITLNSTTGTTNVGAVSVNKGSVSVGVNVTTGDITVPEGNNVTIAGPATTGTLTLGGNGTVNLSISGNGSDIEGITVPAGKGDNLNIRSWPAGRNNNFGTLSLADYAKKQITGGTFSADTKTALGTAGNVDWVDNANLQFIVPMKGTSTDVALYGRDELTEAISSIAATTAADKSKPIVLLGQGDAAAAAKKYIQINFGGNPWAYIEYTATTGIKLPTRINNTTIGKWIVNNSSTLDTGASFVAGTTENIPYLTDGVILDTTETSAEVTKITGVRAASNANVSGSDVRVRLNGNNIELSGAVVPSVGGVASIYVDLLTDVVDTSGDPVTISNVMIDWDSNTKKVTFNAANLSLQGFGAIVEPGGAALVLNRGTGARYTVSANLAVSASNLNLADSTQIIATVGGRLSGWKQEAKQLLIDQIQGGEFDINANLAILEAINAAQATITNRDSVTNWIATARSTVWTQGYKSSNAENNDAPDGYASYTPDGGNEGLLTRHSGTYANAAGDDKDAITDAFTKAWLVPYLQVNVTDYDESGTMTLTMTPSYRVDISGAEYNPEYAYTVQPGRTLGELTGDMATKPVKVSFEMDAEAFATAVMHQDSKYAYTAVDGEWEIYHAGANGLGNMVINLTAAPITMTSTIADRWGTNVLTCPFGYDDLQAAIDDTKAGVTQANSTDSSANPVTETFDTITITGDYSKSCDFTMTGIARKVKVIALGDKPVRCTSQNVDNLDPSGYTYTFQLKRDVVAAGTVILAAQNTAQGTVSLPATSAKAGQTVTVTVVPSVAGQNSIGVTVKTNSGATVSATSTGKVNEYSFVVPAGATSVTVTPNFAASTMANFLVSSNTSQGTAVVTTGTTDGKVQQGTTVPVTVVPSSNSYRTMGLTALGNNGAAAAVTRTGVNTFNVTVPAGATTVTVTPSFDYNNNTPFTDVPYSYWASSDISWIYNKGYTTGYGNGYTFAPTLECTRWEMVTFLWKAAGYQQVSISNPFKDVTPTYPNAQAYQAIMWAYSKGIIAPDKNGNFNPTSKISRADSVVILYKNANSPAASTRTGFKDVATSAYYAKAVSWAEQKGITNGKNSRDTFKPNDTITRQEIAKMLHVAFG